jgi:hypothetical protein
MKNGLVVYYGGFVALQFGGCFYCFSVALALVEFGKIPCGKAMQHMNELIAPARCGLKKLHLRWSDLCLSTL